MTKIALITDTHFGIRNDSVHFHDITKLFLDNTFFPYLRDNSIKSVIHLGDLVDRRKYINFYTLNRLRKDFLEPLTNIVDDIHIIIGNHDVYFKNTNEINAIKEIIDNKYNINFYESATEVKFDGVKILFVPWICDDNREETFNLIKKTKAQICMGHLELIGFQMYKGNVSHEGDDPASFKKFDCVFSGHYHHKSSDGNIHYLGSHTGFTWADFNDPRGFHVFDTETRELTFIENPYSIFKRIVYNDNELPKDIDYSKSIIKVIIQNKTNQYLFDKFIEDLEKQNPIEIQIIEDQLSIEFNNSETIIENTESTIDIFKSYISKSDMKNISKNNLEKLIVELYNEALYV